MASLPLRSFADGKLFGTVHGDGDVRVVYLHGWDRRLHDFDATRAALRERQPTAPACLAIDLPGFGTSPAPPQPGGAIAYANLIEPLLDEACATPVVLVGHSFGGRVAVALAHERPADVAALVLTGVPLVRTSGSAPKSPLSYRMLRWAAKHGLMASDRLEAARQRHGSIDYRNATGVMRDVLVAAVNESYEAMLGDLPMPVELVWGERDTDAPPAQATQAESLLADARLTIISNVGHLLPTKAPTDLAAAVERSLRHLAQ